MTLFGQFLRIGAGCRYSRTAEKGSSRKASFVLCSGVRTARSASYTGLSSQEEGLPFLCLLGNSVRKRQDTSTHLKLAQWGFYVPSNHPAC